ncbi:hypothetical protein SASPL_126560 [Salvia splendens]|uniref:Dynein light chain n=1 Tax=Salvia splendens TaxID=180675 RepID=A0A8X8XHG5_SALSN|nr:uncharacterized protein LOC121747254 isoform X2 [Salvia splendens]KAG6413845.1 hypothetical protein SASPL_126560 [Salvia splendens]
MASDGRRREGVYVYDMVAGAPRAPAAAKGAVWGSLVRSKTYREKNKVGEQPRRSERRSVSGAEGDVGAAAALLQVKVLASDMPGFMQRHAFRCARTTFDALDKFSSKHMAFTIKKFCPSK